MVLDQVLGSTGLEGPLRYCRIVYTGARFRPKVPELLDGLPQSAGFEGLGFRRFRRFPRYWKVLGVGGVKITFLKRAYIFDKGSFMIGSGGCQTYPQMENTLLLGMPPDFFFFGLQNVMGLCPL